LKWIRIRIGRPWLRIRIRTQPWFLAKPLVVTSHFVFMVENAENLDLSSGGVEADERLQDVKDLRLAAVEHVLAQVHVQRLRVRRQRVVPAQESTS
jgi:hypothetical protein